MAVRLDFLIICILCYTVLVGTCWGHIYGGRRSISTDDPEVLTLSRWAAKRLGGTCTSVTRAERQVVSGMMYFIRFKMKEAGKTYNCEVKVWTQPWHHRTNLVEHHCVIEGNASQLLWNL